MKKILTLTLGLILILQASSAFAEDYSNYIHTEGNDPFNNPVFEVVTPITQAAQSDSEIIGSYYSIDYDNPVQDDTYNLYGYHFYKDGIEVTELISNNSKYLWTYTSDSDQKDTQKNFNDGLIYKSMYDTGDIGGYYDMNENRYYTNLQLSYTAYDYNLGYVNEVKNNGGDLPGDLQNADFEKLRRFETVIYDTVSSVSYSFENCKINRFFDSGYSVMMRKDDDGNRLYYLIKLKKPNIVTVFLDGEKILFDQLPIIENDRTLVPLRAIFEALGADISWDDATKTVTAEKGETTISLTIDKTTATKNDEEITLDVPAKIVSGRTLVPVRFIADCFGVNVDWNNDMRQVILNNK